ncbi:MAG: hypothetical protein NVSMB46_05810 [Candidatus Saccharimonadales bacterium]
MTRHLKKTKNPVKIAYRDIIYYKYKDHNFWILATFVPTLIIARLVVFIFPQTHFHVHKLHIHHFAYGILLLGISGYIAITRRERAPFWLAAIYGVGLGLAVDETGIWVRLNDHYYTRQSYDAIFIVLALLINAVYFRHFWLAVLHIFVRSIKKIS